MSGSSMSLSYDVTRVPDTPTRLPGPSRFTARSVSFVRSEESSRLEAVVPCTAQGQRVDPVVMHGVSPAHPRVDEEPRYERPRRPRHGTRGTIAVPRAASATV